MALMKCPECKKDMSDTLNACPHCGFKRVQQPIPDASSNNFCTNCGKPYDKDISHCPYCNAKNITAQNADNPILNVNPNNTTCIGCGKPYYKGANKCPYCKVKNIKSLPGDNLTIDVSNLKSMVKCDCGKVYSIYTKVCPICKKVNVNFKKTPVLKFALIAFAVIIIGFAISKGFDTNSTNISQNNVNSNVRGNIASKDIVYKIGDRGPAGGWIFYDKGNSKGGWRYLEAAPDDIKGRINWSDGKLLKIGSTSINIGSGKKNTQRILNICGNKNSASKLCSNYRGGGKSDWFLPSKDELNLMYKNLYKQGIGNFSSEAVYWSSTEYNAERALLQDFYSGMQDEGVKNLYDEPLTDMAAESFVRAIRAF